MRFEAVFFRQSPGFFQLVEAAVADLLLEARVEIDGLDAERLAHAVEQSAGDSQALLRGHGAEQRVRLAPFFLVLAASLELPVADIQEVELLQVGVGDAPAALQIEIEPVAQNVAQGLEGIARLEAPGLGVGGVVRRGQAQAVEHALGQHVVGQAALRVLSNGGEQRGPAATESG